MKKVVFHLHTGYCGCDANDLVEVEDDMSDDELDWMAWDMAVDHASSYGQELCSDECDDEDCDMEHPGSTNIEGSWELYDAEKHDGLL